MQHKDNWWLSRSLRRLGTMLTFIQILLFCPLALDVAGKQCFLAFTASLAGFYSSYATMQLLLRNTRFFWISTTLGFLQVFLVPSLLLICFNLYSDEDQISRQNSPWLASSRSRPFQTDQSSGISAMTFQAAQAWSEAVPWAWEHFLRSSSPLFALLEGTSSVLVIQSAGQISRWVVDRKGEAFSIVFLVTAASSYVISGYFLLSTYVTAQLDPWNATLIGVALTATCFLIGVSFWARKGNVIESALMFGYVAYSVYMVSSDLGRKPDLDHGFFEFLNRTGVNSQEHSSLPPLLIRAYMSLIKEASSRMGSSMEFISAASAAIPLPIFISLIYRVSVLYVASRIVIRIKIASSPLTSEGERRRPRLSEEEPTEQAMTVLIAFSRTILIAVYSHLLLNQGRTPHVSLWRWLNCGIALVLYGCELAYGRDEADRDGLTKDWKVE